MKEININGTIYQNPLLVFALEVEAQEEFNDFQNFKLAFRHLHS